MRWDTHTATFLDLLRHLDELCDTLLRKRRDRNDRHIVEGWKIFVNLLNERISCLRVLFDEIPLIQCDDDSLTGFNDFCNHALVLRFQTLYGVDDHDCHVATINSA